MLLNNNNNHTKTALQHGKFLYLLRAMLAENQGAKTAGMRQPISGQHYLTTMLWTYKYVYTGVGCPEKRWKPCHWRQDGSSSHLVLSPAVPTHMPKPLPETPLNTGLAVPGSEQHENHVGAPSSRDRHPAFPPIISSSVIGREHRRHTRVIEP